MGLDGTIKRADGKPLGPIGVVQEALRTVFPGIVFGSLPSGLEKIAAAKARGVEFPDVIRLALESQPSELGADFENESFTASFFLGSALIVESVGVLLYGQTQESESFWQRLTQSAGWIITHP